MINKKKVTMASLSTISMAFNPRDWSIEICQLQSNAKQFTNPSMHRKNCELPTVPLRILMRLQKSIQQMRATHVQHGVRRSKCKEHTKQDNGSSFSFGNWKCQCRNQPWFSGATNKANVLSSAAIPDSEPMVCTILCALKIQTWC